MIKRILALIFTVTLFACGNDDDNNTSNNNDALVGQWKITSRTVDGQSVALGECEPFSVYTYNQTGTYTELHYAADQNSDCLNNPSTEFSGTWQKLGSNNYRFTNMTNEALNATIEFDSNNSFTKTFLGFPDIEDEVLNTVIEIYVRI